MLQEQTYEKALRARGLVVTPLRLAIMDALHRHGATARAGDLLEAVRRRRRIHKTTLYRNLAALEAAGLVRKVPSDGRSAVYELSCPHRAPVHPHFTCRRCHKIVCLDPVDLSSVWALLMQNSGLKPERAEVTLVGLCRECARRGTDRS